jgi:hypothetical protein
MPPRRAPLPAIGWREWVHLPDLGAVTLKAKVDTGARTSALHAFALRRFTVDGVEWVRFDIHPDQRSGIGSTTVECPVADWRTVRSSSGHSERRPVIRTTLEVVQQRLLTEVTLTNRDEMGFRMLLGRAALRKRFVVDPGRSYFGGRRRRAEQGTP